MTAQLCDAGLMCKILKTNVMQAPANQNRALRDQDEASVVVNSSYH